MPPRSALNSPPPKVQRGNPETILQAEIMVALGQIPGVTVWRNNIGVAVYDSGARVEYGVGGKGAPDLLCEVAYLHTTVALWLEVKTSVGVVEEHQRRWHAAARRGGRLVAVVRSVADAKQAVHEVQWNGTIVTDDHAEVSRG